MAGCCRPAKAESVHLYLDCHDETQACVVFQRGTEWLLVAWDLTTGETRRGQWLGRAKLRLCCCSLYKGLFQYTYSEMREGMHMHQVVSRAPFFTALLHFPCSWCEGIRQLQGAELRVAVRGDPDDVRSAMDPDTSTVLQWPACKGWQALAAERGEALVPTAPPRFSSKPTVSATSGTHLGRAFRLEQARVFVDGRLALDLTGAAFQRVKPPDGYR